MKFGQYSNGCKTSPTQTHTRKRKRRKEGEEEEEEEMESKNWLQQRAYDSV